MKINLALLGLTLATASSALASTPISHCFEIAAPLQCQNDLYQLTLQSADCFHTGTSVNITRTDGVVIVSGLQVTDTTPQVAAGVLPQVLTYAANDGFEFSVKNTPSPSTDNSFQYNVPKGEQISESNMNCSY